MNKKISLLSELIEHSAEANKLLISNAIDMENGEILQAQKNLKNASSLLSIMIKDIFAEIKEIVNNTDDEEDYDFSILDISKLLTNVIYNASTLINAIINNISEIVVKTMESKLEKNINAVISLTQSLLLN